MRKISVKNIVQFYNKPEKSKRSFLKSINKIKEPDNEGGGGNYWVRSLSALSNAYKYNNTQFIKDKIDEISEDYNKSNRNQTKEMYQKNLNILHKYEDFNFSKYYPNETFRILNKVSKKSIIEIDKVPVQVLPTQIFKFEKDGIDFVGGIWFVAKLERYKNHELGIFSEVLYNYLILNFGNNYAVSPEFCTIVDVLNQVEVNYRMIMDNTITSLLRPTLKSIRDNL